MTTPKAGALTYADIQAIWQGAVDENFREPLESVGNGGGIEAYSQAWEVFERVSRAVDVTTQAMYIFPHSSQTNPPAAGEAKAIVTLTFTRSNARSNAPLRLAAGTIFIAHQVRDWGVNEGQDVLTGLRFILTQDVLFQPGETGTKTAQATAEKPGYSYNDPLPNTLVVIEQPGNQFENDLASVIVSGPTGLVAPTVARASIQSANQADMFVPEHVGQYVQFVAGSNIGKIARIKQFYPPDPANNLGSKVDLEIAQTAQGTTFAGTFVAGETLRFTNGGPTIAEGACFGEQVVSGLKRVTFDTLRGNFGVVTAGTVITGATSGATLTIVSVIFSQLFVAETGTASWAIQDWELALGLSVTNASQPAGGLAGWLDELGADRNINRSPSESDDTYRVRVGTPADVVTPNAIRRALSRVLGTIPWCLREVGTTKLLGFFFDQDAYDYDNFSVPGALTGTFLANERVVLEQHTPAGGPLLIKVQGYFGRMESANTVFRFIRINGQPPTTIAASTHRVRGLTSGATFLISGNASIPATVVANRFKLWLDYKDFRGYFLVGVPRLSIGEFGFPYDNGVRNAFDTPIFFDGFPVGVKPIYARVKQAVDQARLGGVGFDMYLINEPCS